MRKTMKTSTIHSTRVLAENQGFTLIEIMVVIIILGLLATLVIPNITGYTEKAKREKARADIASLEGALELFKADNGFYPTTEQGLDALIVKPSTGRIPAKWMDGGYFKKGVPLDPWGNHYEYFAPGRRGEGYEVVSLGTDGQASDDDVSSSDHLDTGRAVAR
jgi:general secretion pathway protein G